jgi:hypothetical protein
VNFDVSRVSMFLSSESGDGFLILSMVVSYILLFSFFFFVFVFFWLVCDVKKVRTFRSGVDRLCFGLLRLRGLC